MQTAEYHSRFIRPAVNRYIQAGAALLYLRYEKGVAMEIPGKVSLYCPLIDAKGTSATLVAISSDGYYHLEVSIKGAKHVMLAPIAHSALYFADPEPVIPADFEIER